jgi:hypothetical protein
MVSWWERLLSIIVVVVALAVAIALSEWVAGRVR